MRFVYEVGYVRNTHPWRSPPPRLPSPSPPPPSFVPCLSARSGGVQTHTETCGTGLGRRPCYATSPPGTTRRRGGVSPKYARHGTRRETAAVLSVPQVCTYAFLCYDGDKDNIPTSIPRLRGNPVGSQFEATRWWQRWWRRRRLGRVY